MSALTRPVLLIGLTLILTLAGCRTPTAAPTAPPTAVAASVAPVTRAAPALKTITPAPAARAPVTPTLGFGTVRVDAGDNFYYPTVVTVTVGTAVQWHHVGQTAHDVTAADRSWGVALIPLGGYWEYTFRQAGVYDYYCLIHAPGMTGRVVVVK